jgi:ABC-type Zn uptake system ZnuABC Zn-binding protein ZnuA
VSYVGGKDVAVDDLAPPGAQPENLALGPSQRATLGPAALVVDVGDGYQPQVEQAARSVHRLLAVLPAVSRQVQPYEFWLDPYLMAKAATAVARVLTAAEPAGRSQFQNGARDFQAVAGSIESDYVSTLSECTRQVFVSADGAFGRMATSFGLVDVAVSTVGVNKAVAQVAEGSLPAVFSEVGVPSGALRRVADQSRAGVRSLDPMEVAPPAGTSTLSYFSVMEEDLTALEGSLDCDTSESFS